MHSHVQLCISYARWWKVWLHGHVYVCSCMFMYSHAQLCIAMHGGGRLGCMVMHAKGRSCIVMYSCVLLCMVAEGSVAWS